MSNMQTSASSAVEEIHRAEFPGAVARPSAQGRMPIQRFYDVNVEVTVQLGRVTMPIGELLRVNEGTVLELERAISEPVDIVAQGVRLARGEVVVVEDRYAVRITEIESTDTHKNGRSASAES